jgi:site-specific DNA-methyltransferase (adenine-specific)
MKSLESDSVDLILTSPPYEDARTYGGHSWKVKYLHRLGTESFRVLKSGGIVCIVIWGPVREYIKGRGTERSVSAFQMILDWRKIGFRFLDALAYGRLGVPGEYKGRFRCDWEICPVFIKPGAPHTVEKHRIAKKSRYVKRGLTSSRRSNGSMYKRKASGHNINFGVTNPSTFWWYGSVGHGHDPSCSTGHPATFSEAFARDVVRVFSNEGDLVIDPFVGSGTTGVVSLQERRRFLGFDVWKEAISIARRRIRKCLEMKPLFG